MDLVGGRFGSEMERFRSRFMDRSMDGSYAVKYVKPGLLLKPGIGPAAAADLVMETRILRNLPGHPNIAPVYGANRKGRSSGC